jgi:hypothetical protein
MSKPAHETTYPQPRSSEGSAAPAAAVQRVVMTAQKAQADVLLHRLHYAPPGWDAAAERRDAQDELHSAAQARAWADGDFDADHAALGPAEWAARRIRAGCAASLIGSEAAAVRAPLLYKPPPPKKYGCEGRVRKI